MVQFDLLVAGAKLIQGGGPRLYVDGAKVFQHSGGGEARLVI